MKQPWVSIIIVTYQEKDYLEKTLESVKNFNWRNVEVIVVDTGYTNEISLLADEYNCKYIKSPVFRAKNIGVNFATEIAKGKYLLLLDNDVELEDPNILSDLISESQNLDNFG